MTTHPLARLAAALLCAALAGCSSLLPHGSSDSPSSFASFEAARAALERIEAMRTPTSGLRTLGFDTSAANVTLIPYPDVVARLAPNPGVALADLDPGIVRCILAKTGCRAWLFHFEHQEREREGSFWLDFFNVRRATRVRGWWLDALIVESDGVVLFRNYGGQALIDRQERQINPLGPLQPAGESAGALIK